MKVKYLKKFSYTFKKTPIQMEIIAVVETDDKGKKYEKFIKKFEKKLKKIMDK